MEAEAVGAILADAIKRCANTLAHDWSMRDVVSYSGRKGQEGAITRGDLWVDRTVRGQLLARLDVAAFVSEESVDRCLTSLPIRGRVVVLDPIDGSSAYASGGSGYAIAIASLLDGEPEAAVLVYPDHDEIYAAASHPALISIGVSQGAIAVRPSQQHHFAGQMGWWSSYELLPVNSFTGRGRALLTGAAESAVVLPVDHKMFVWDWLPTSMVLQSFGIEVSTLGGTPLVNVRDIVYEGGWFATRGPCAKRDKLRRAAIDGLAARA